MKRGASTVFLLLLQIQIFSQTATAPASGDGSSGNPYQIATLNNLYWIAAHNSVVASPTQANRFNKYYIQTADIDASSTSSWFSGSGWLPIGHTVTRFTGNYNGGGYKIDGLYINRTSNDSVGLFGYVQGGTLQNLGVTNVSVSGKGSVGALAGSLRSTSNVTNCYSTGSVTGTTNAIGGLVGYAHTYGTFARSYSSCTVVSTATSDDWVGGLIGVSNENGNISNCYATGNVNGYQRVGGLIGFSVNGGLSFLGRCYSTGKVTGGQVNNIGGLVGDNSLQPYTSKTFWDQQTSGISTAMTGGLPKTTALMKTSTTFTDSGWDFTGESINGTNDYWSRSDDKNGGYPYLSWQTFPYTITFTDGSGFIQNPTKGATNQAIGRIALRTNTVGAEFNGIWIQLNGTRSGATNFKLWESSDNSFDSGSDTKIGSTVAADPGNGGYIWFMGLTTRLSTSDKYYFLTCDLSGTASGTISPILVGDKELMLGFGTVSSSINNAAMSNGNSPLPVELTSFNVVVKGNSVELKWTTATEVNNYGFEIERIKKSTDAAWQTIGFVDGHGNSNSVKQYSFYDNNVTRGQYVYRLKQIDTDGQFTYSHALEVDLLNRVWDFSLTQNYPNPFNPSTTFSFSIPDAGRVTIAVYDIIGNLVAIAADRYFEPGSHNIEFDAGALPSGIYIYRIKTSGFTAQKKLTLLK